MVDNCKERYTFLFYREVEQFGSSPVSLAGSRGFKSHPRNHLKLGGGIKRKKQKIMLEDQEL